MKSDFKYFHKLRVRYAEIDGQGIVFNSHYLTYADVAVTEYFRFLGLDYKTLAQSGNMDIAVVKTTLDFKGSAYFDDMLDIGVRVSSLGTKSFIVDFEIFREDSADLIVGIQTVYVNYNVSQRSAHPLPEYFVDPVTRFEGQKLVVTASPGK